MRNNYLIKKCLINLGHSYLKRRVCIHVNLKNFYITIAFRICCPFLKPIVLYICPNHTNTDNAGIFI
jgi:hypothetical protein